MLGAQTTAASRPRKEKAGQAPTLRESILERAHVALGPLTPEEHASLLGKLVRVASDYKSPRVGEWAEELFQTANQLSGEPRRRAQADAIESMTRLDQARAAAMLTQMDPDPPRDPVHPGAQLRAQAAQRLIEVVWGRFKEAGVPVIRQLANTLAQSGGYPFAAVGQVIQQLGTKNADLNQELFHDAFAAYQQQSSAEADIAFERFLGPINEVVNREQLKTAYHLLVRNLETHDSPFRGETVTSSKGSVSISYFDTELFQLIPLIRKVDPEFAAEIQRDHPKIAQAQSVAGADTVHYQIAGAKPYTPPQEEQDLDRGVRMLQSSNDPAMLAQAMPDATQRAMVFANAAQQYVDRDHAQAVAYLHDGFALVDSVNDPGQKLRALVSVAWSADAVNDQSIRRQAINEAFPIAERLARDEFDDQGRYKPGQGSEALGRLVMLGMETDPDATLARIDQVPIPILRAGLLLDAASSALPEKKSE